MNAEDLKIVVMNIYETIKEAEKYNFFGDVLTRLKITNCGLNYDYEYIRVNFSKYYKCSLYNYVRKKIFESIIAKIANGETKPPKGKRQKFLGINQFVIKVEKFYNNSFDEIIKNYRDNLESQSQTIDEIEALLKKIDFVTKYEFDTEAQTEFVEMDTIKYFMFLMDLYRPITVTQSIKESLDNQTSDFEKKIFLLAIEKYTNMGSDKGSTVKLSNEELILGIHRLDSYDLQSPIAFGNKYLYCHTFDEEEKAFLTKTIRKHFDTLTNHLMFINTYSIFRDYIPEFHYYSQKMFNLRYISKKNSPKKAASINDFIELIQRGLVVTSNSLISS